MKVFYIFLLVGPLYAQSIQMEDSLKKEFLADPAFSRRCNKLLDKRRDKVEHKNRLNALKMKNEYLQKQTPKQKVTIQTKLKKNLFKLNQEIRITALKIENLEEKIIKKGCSGLIL